MVQQQGPETVESKVMTVTESGRVVIRATYHGPTDTRGTRIRVRRWDGSAWGVDPYRITVGWDYALNTGENYAAAVREYLARAGWGGHWTVATCDGGAVAVYVGKIGG